VPSARRKLKLAAPLDPSLRRPFRILDGSSDHGPRLGGRAPAFTEAPRLRSIAEYVLTFPFSEDPELFGSVFVNCTFEELLDAMNQGLQRDDRIVTVLHAALPRGRSDNWRSPLTEHPLRVGEVVADAIDDGQGGVVIASDHKLGGRPDCIQEPELEGAVALMESGYVQALQLDFPGPEDGSIAGNWPFADGLFNLFLPVAGGESVWAFQK
jgi:hypothetical protein